MSRFLLMMCALFSASVFANTKVVFQTTLGNFTIQLDEVKAPITSANFLRYVKDGSYEGTIFHRVIPNFMAQGGGFNQDMTQIQTYGPIKNEANNGLVNKVGSVAMARTNDPDSATRQFFINYSDNDFLNYSRSNPGYAVFGQVVDGYDVVQQMAKVRTNNSGFMKDVPATPIVVTKVTIEK
ncbi:peptidyl-prolyl cis-trans isomerase [Vibrio sp. UCD-FRSSP16_10]|uniref:peptidylprolyl isomerase n=1 Tax=unclassified Vibrio TaxID=2614977 RepID=UPI000800C5F0|nr:MULTISPECIES: peptidylprolyl isomerase [unclassified Vibrio]OBT06556.1 peptidyl-prolyl cis-trans isomerase [Vibrio sp. UCD-FRSSP16_30]OBT12253.1 peptidyl-prolyl cis-trans isomerase [Vibrio sp. UCD-FRSSP16_10]